LKLLRLHEEYMHAARRPMTFGRLPVMPRESDVPILPSDKWRKIDGSLVKTYQFRATDLRNDFVRQILSHEEEVQHSALITINEDTVTLSLRTKDIDQITELDKEYARWSDELFKDVIYSLSNDNR